MTEARSEISKQRPARARRRALALVLGLLLTAGLIEAGLWIAYAFQKPEPVFEMGPVGTGSRTILCIGDSNTYGVHLPRDQSYPGQLQAFLDRWPENPWRVVNVGYPGDNSAEVRGRLAGHLKEYQPEVVVCWVGVNNTWSFAGRHLWEHPDREVEPSPFERLAQSVRVLKLARMAINQVASKIRGGGSSKVAPPQRIRETLHVDFLRIRDICTEHGAKLLMADYPVHIEYTERVVNAVLREISARAGIPIVRLYERFLPVAYRVGYKRAMFADYHANEVGNHEVARLVLLALIENGMLEARSEWTGVPAVHETLEDWPFLIADHDAERALVVMRGPPGAHYRIRIERIYSRGGDLTRNTRPLPYRRYDAWSDEELAQRGFFGALDAEGRGHAELSLPPEPERHPEPDGRPVLWLGWRLQVQYESASGVPLADPEPVVDALLGSALQPARSRRGGE